MADRKQCGYLEKLTFRGLDFYGNEQGILQITVSRPAQTYRNRPGPVVADQNFLLALPLVVEPRDKMTGAMSSKAYS
ncbi:MAG: hypothetical protein R3F41_12040 [Gammaproteobacteria bacterium]|nr:hypothetical protein [Pseudomonadales bacterium]MCP5348826.1 hypothetical protein [Pseudomonadales bacterium]